MDRLSPNRDFILLMGGLVVITAFLAAAVFR